MKSSSSFRILGLSLLAMMFAGCGGTLRQDMANQPRNNPLSPSDFFADGRAARQPVDNTVVRGSVELVALNTPKDSNAFPLPVNEQLLTRGKERYAIFCTPCHGI